VIEFRKAKIPDELDELQRLDRRIFADFPGDFFELEDWEGFESYWMLDDGVIVGCSAFLPNIDFNDGPRSGCLYIVSTGVLPEMRRRSYGRKQKEWQIEFAKQHGFHTIVTNMRRTNRPIIRLNESLGFKFREIAPSFYSDPEEDAIVMELDLTRPKS